MLDPDEWVLATEQSLLLILIIARWLLPKGAITRDQLSQLLLVYIAMASDIMELFILFEDPGILSENYLGHIVLAVWTVSLLQFTLVLTATKGRRSRLAFIKPEAAVFSAEGKKIKTRCCETELWSLLTTIVMQDAPFLAIRLYVIFDLHTYNYALMFFTFKNLLVIFLQMYRMSAVLLKVSRNK